MSAPTFTPPPWKFERMESAIEYAALTGKTLEEHDGYFRSNNGDWIVSRTDPDGEMGGPICEVAFRGKAKRGEAYRAPDPEGQANAHLIAAAPDGYAVAGAFIMAAINEWDIPEGADEGWILDTLGHGLGGAYLDAIAYRAKARGES